MNNIEERTSPIHGRGVFARKKIARGEFIGQYLGRRTNVDGMHTLWVESDGDWRGYAGFGLLRFLNHAPRPNAEFSDRDLYARRSIPVGDEITIDYGEEWSDA